MVFTEFFDRFLIRTLLLRAVLRNLFTDLKESLVNDVLCIPFEFQTIAFMALMLEIFD